MNQIALLVGLFVPPLLLLSIGYQFRDVSPRMKSIFWGGIVGWLIGLAGVTLTLIVDPVLWPDTGVRNAIVYWGLLLAPVAGMALGGIRPLR